MSTLRLAPFTATTLLLLAGCQTYQQQSSGLASSFRSADIASAVASTDREAAAKTGSKDEILWKLEQGATLRTAALADPSLLPPPAIDPATPAAALTPAQISASYARRSLAAFDGAEVKVNEWEEKARIKVASQGISIITNQATLPYRGRAYDKVLLNTYQALNYLQLGQIDPARVQLNRALQRQRDAVELNQKRLAEAQDEANQAREGNVTDESGKPASSYDVDRARADGSTGPALDAALAQSTPPLAKAYGDYVNPFAVFMDGLFFSICGENGSDWERGRKSIERVSQLVSDNPYLADEVAQANAAAEGKAPGAVTYVIFETGTGPARDQVRIDIPTFVATSRLSYVGAAFPKLTFNDDYLSSLNVTASGQTFTTATLAEMDSVVANDFKNEWPSVVTKTLVSAATKAVALGVMQKQLSDQSQIAGLLGGLALGGLSAGTTIADTRTWLTLPKQFQYARFPTPADRQITLTAGGQTKILTLDPGTVNVVYVKSVAASAPLLATQFLLK
jgi:uncharacterized protein